MKTAIGIDPTAWEEEGVPTNYYYQVQWQLYVTGAAKGYVACLPAGNAGKFMIREVWLDEALVWKMVEAANTFIHCLDTGEAPLALKNDLSNLPLSEGSEEQYEPDEEFLELYSRFKESEDKDLKVQLAQLMGDKPTCSFSYGGKIVTITRKIINVKPSVASSYQKITIKED